MHAPHLYRTSPVSTPHSGTSPWWRTAVVYQVYPRSFADSNGDGYGDLPGITKRLGHLTRLGVDALWLSPFYRSPQHDGGYDVADYRDVDPLFGTLADADALIERAHQLGLRVVIDLVPNHTSDEHAWFRAALAAGPGSAERARYLFRDGRGENGELPPNNWRSVFGQPGWSRVTEADGTPGQWYLHLFDVHQPDLDWTNPEVIEEFHDILRFWLDRGVDGFRVDVAHGLVKAEGLPDWSGHSSMISETESGAEDLEAEAAGVVVGGDEENDDDVTAPGPAADGSAPPPANDGPMWNQPGVHEIYRGWNRVLAEYEGDRMLVAEAWVEPLSSLAEYVRPDEMQQTFNFAFLSAHWHADTMRAVIEQSLRTNDAVGAPTTWVLSNHDVVRHASRFGMPSRGGNVAAIGPDSLQPDREAGSAPGPSRDAPRSSRCRARRTSTRVRSSGCPSTPRYRTRSARTRSSCAATGWAGTVAACRSPGRRKVRRSGSRRTGRAGSRSPRTGQRSRSTPRRACGGRPTRCTGGHCGCAGTSTSGRAGSRSSTRPSPRCSASSTGSDHPRQHGRGGERADRGPRGAARERAAARA